MGIHTGTPHIGEEGYIGTDVHRAARIAAAGHGGQVLVSAATAALVATDGLRDLGEHRLKDLSAPERIYQLGHADFPSLKSLHQTNLPILATPFLGLGQEVAEVIALLNRAAVRLLTLTGPGGTGKTRLALQSATASTATFAGGVWWVPLRRLRCHDEQTPPVRPSPAGRNVLGPLPGPCNSYVRLAWSCLGVPTSTTACDYLRLGCGWCLWPRPTLRQLPLKLMHYRPLTSLEFWYCKARSLTGNGAV
ncbi:MAG: adenylate/guanylate cyclase domain-containing protein [Chloroflexi bacterium]|nr:adenylate/guanylate cyclase domain-containing protein [Chloroflexota bacterium]